MFECLSCILCWEWQNKPAKSIIKQQMWNIEPWAAMGWMNSRIIKSTSLTLSSSLLWLLFNHHCSCSYCWYHCCCCHCCYCYCCFCYHCYCYYYYHHHHCYYYMIIIITIIIITIIIVIMINIINIITVIIIIIIVIIVINIWDWQQREHQSCVFLSLFEGNPPVYGGIPSQRASNGKSVPCL